MKRAEVWKIDGQWVAGIDHRPSFHVFSRHHAIADRPYALNNQDDYPTHAEALHAALEAVSLAATNPEPMEAP